jgi:hypothetical protein
VQVVADGGVVVLQVNRVPVENAVVCIYLVHDLLRDHAPRSDWLYQLVVCVDIVIRDTVTHDETFQVDSVIILLIHLLLEVPLMDLPSQVGNIDAGIWLTGDVHLIGSVFGERIEEVLEASK